MDHVDRNYKLFHRRIGTEYAISSLSLPSYDEGQENNAHARDVSRPSSFFVSILSVLVFACFAMDAASPETLKSNTLKIDSTVRKGRRGALLSKMLFSVSSVDGGVSCLYYQFLFALVRSFRG